MIYGNNGTVHGTEKLNIEVDRKGNILSVWFRCSTLPFDVTVVNKDRANEMRKHHEEAEKGGTFRPLLGVVLDDFAENEPFTVRHNVRDEWYEGYEWLVIERANSRVVAYLQNEDTALAFAEQLNVQGFIVVL